MSRCCRRVRECVRSGRLGSLDQRRTGDTSGPGWSHGRAAEGACHRTSTDPSNEPSTESPIEPRIEPQESRQWVIRELRVIRELPRIRSPEPARRSAPVVLRERGAGSHIVQLGSTTCADAVPMSRARPCDALVAGRNELPADACPVRGPEQPDIGHHVRCDSDCTSSAPTKSDEDLRR
jgi:hypothetical protein